MAYNPTNWECGDVVTAEKLNKLEEAVENLSLAIEGGGSEPLVVRVTMEQDTPSAGEITYTLDKTWQEISDAFPNVYILNEEGVARYPGKIIIERVLSDPREPEYFVYENDQSDPFSTDSPSGYPSYVYNGAA